MGQKIPVIPVTLSLSSAIIGYLAYIRSDLISGILVTFMTGWILFQFRNWETAWGSLGNFQNPILFAINTSFLAYIYSTLNQVSSGHALRISVGAFLLGLTISFMISKYWNIGP